MIGKPKFKLDQKVKFKLEDTWYYGIIRIIDKWRTFEDDSDVSYDIEVEHPSPCLYKHINEQLISDLVIPDEETIKEIYEICSCDLSSNCRDIDHIQYIQYRLMGGHLDEEEWFKSLCLITN